MNEEIIRTIAEYDGWAKVYTEGENAPMELWWDTIYGRGYKENIGFYLTDLKALHKVAMWVIDELQAYIDNPKTTNYGMGIYFGCRQKPNEQGEYTDLMTSVYNGIVYLKNLKDGN